MSQVIIGAIAMGFGIAGLFFLRFWRETRDRLFFFFSLSFFVLAINRVWTAFISSRDAHGDYVYWVRLLAFAIILLAIIDKNAFRSPANE